MTDNTTEQSLQSRVAQIDWAGVATSLDEVGCARTGELLSPAECAAFARSYADQTLFRRRIVMARHGYGSGEYQYFAYPLPEAVVSLRALLYRQLAPIANRWAGALGGVADFPPDHADWLKRCHDAGQTRPTPLLLRYAAGDYNCLHQDLYGALYFPLQVAFLLSDPSRDFDGGEFVLTEQRPRQQSRAEVVAPRQGEGVIFAVNHRPIAGARGARRVTMRHGVSRLRAGTRFTLGIIFHDAA